MTFLDHAALFGPADYAGVLFLLISWFGLSFWIEHPGSKWPSVTVIMADYRRAWMRELVTREPRVFDAMLLSSLRQGTSFFASTSVIGIGGVLALIGNTDRLQIFAADLTLTDAPAVIWQMKLLVVALFLTQAFLKFVWANRLFGYCAVVMASVPNDLADERTYPRAAQAGEINIRAAWNFNRGLRALYYALGTLAWLLGPYALILATVMVNYTIWQREFYSLPRKILAQEAAIGGDTP